MPIWVSLQMFRLCQGTVLLGRKEHRGNGELLWRGFSIGWCWSTAGDLGHCWRLPSNWNHVRYLERVEGKKMVIDMEERAVWVGASKYSFSALCGKPFDI